MKTGQNDESEDRQFKAARLMMTMTMMMMTSEFV